MFCFQYIPEVSIFKLLFGYSFPRKDPPIVCVNEIYSENKLSRIQLAANELIRFFLIIKIDEM